MGWQEGAELRELAAGRASDAGELRAANTALQQELQSWRAACDFLEARLVSNTAIVVLEYVLRPWSTCCVLTR